jgi:hypothetical protein
VALYNRLDRRTHEHLPREIPPDVLAEVRGELVRAAVRIPIVAGRQRIG